MNKDSKIFVAGHRGLVGSAILKNLKAKGYTNFVLRTHAELDLTDQQAVHDFFAAEKPEYVFLKTKLHSSFKTLIQNISFFLVLFICVYRHKSVKYDLGGRDCKNILVCTNLYRCCFVFCRSHSAGRKTSPDKLIQSELIS